MTKSKRNNMASQKGGTAMGYRNAFQPPNVSNDGQKILVRHKELMREVNSQTNFASANARVNPADPETFPWLAGVATRYEKYRFRKLKFTLVPQVPTTQPGSLGLFFDYDATDAEAPNATEFFSNMNAVTSQIWMESSTNAVPQQEELFCLTESGSENPKWFDYGRIRYFMQSPTTV